MVSVPWQRLAASSSLWRRLWPQHKISETFLLARVRPRGARLYTFAVRTSETGGDGRSLMAEPTQRHGNKRRFHTFCGTRCSKEKLCKFKFNIIFDSIVLGAFCVGVQIM